MNNEWCTEIVPEDSQHTTHMDVGNAENAYVQDVWTDIFSCNICTSTIRGGRIRVTHRYTDVTY